MPILEIITIGTEILLGEIFDTNSRYLALECRKYGIDLYRVQSIGDNPTRIAEIMREAFSRADIVITTGGLGPTVDDPTRQAAADAFGTELEYHPELFQVINDRMRKLGRSVSENQKKQAFIPKLASAIHNPVGTAPAFYIATNGKVLISLPGVPSEMEYLWNISVLPLLKNLFDLKTIIHVRKLRTYGLGEGAIDQKIADLETSLNPTVGLSAHFGYVDIRITSKSDSAESANVSLDAMESEIRSRLPEIIFGSNDESIESAIEKMLISLKQPARVILDGDSGFLKKFEGINPNIEFFTEGSSASPIANPTITIRQDIANWIVQLILEHPTQPIIHTRAYLGNPEHYPEWRSNVALGEFWLALNTLFSETK